MAEPAAQGSDDEIGTIVGYFAHVGAATLTLQRGSLQIGDAIWIKGHTTDLRQTVDSMQVDRQPVQQAAPGVEVAIKVQDRVRRHDRVYKV